MEAEALKQNEVGDAAYQHALIFAQEISKNVIEIKINMMNTVILFIKIK